MIFDPKIFRAFVSSTLQMSDSMMKDWGYSKPVLYSQEATELLLGTCAVESAFGKYRKQIGGPALSIFQIEPDTEKSIWKDMFPSKPGLERLCNELAGVDRPGDEYNLVNNLVYGILMTRFRYLWVRGSIPQTLDGIAEYWKTGYNTIYGKGTPEKFKEAYEKYTI